MPLSLMTVTCSIESISPLCQSRNHGEPKLEGEQDDALDIRTWRQRMHVKNGTVHIPAKAMHDALAEAAKYSKRKIPGQGKATWTQKFASGITILEDIDLRVDPDTVGHVPVFCHATGVPGSGKRVIRRFPIIPQWVATFEVTILDPIITEDIFTEMLEQAGMFIGIGQNRPQNRGVHGRFRVLGVEWKGERQPDLKRRAAA
jgi:hypothetical protein